MTDFQHPSEDSEREQIARAQALLKAVERFLREEAKHARALKAHEKDHRPNAGGPSRDAADLAHADLCLAFTAADCRKADAIIALRSEARRPLVEPTAAMIDAATDAYSLAVDHRYSRRAAMDGALRAALAAVQSGEGDSSARSKPCGEGVA